MLINMKEEFPDVYTLGCGEWSKYSRHYITSDDDVIQIALYRESMDNNEYAGRLTLHIFYNDDVICCSDMGSQMELKRMCE